jgi:uncharacterized protein (DUF1501 family)
MSNQRPEPVSPSVLSRRQFLSLLGLTSGAAVLPSLVDSTSAEAAEAKAAKTKAAKGKKAVAKPAAKTPGSLALTSEPAAKPVAGPRVLVVVEMLGGNDGFSMLVPSGNARFRKLRDRAWLQDKDLSPFGDQYSIAAGLAPLASRLAFVEGVGVAKPDFSHTSMATRWWQGDPDGTGSTRTGFLGRCCDLIPANVPVVGVSVGGGSTPALISAKAPTVALPNLDSLRELTQDRDDRMRVSMGALTDGAGDTAGLEFVDGDLMARARYGLGSGLQLLNGLSGVNGKALGYGKDNRLGASLALVRELISLNVGIQVLHVPWGSFDTHTGHQWSHPEQMRQLGAALTAFHNDLVRSGLSDRVLLATTSEFGRRPEANAGGTDHGAASTMALLGPVKPGRHGGPVNFEQLDPSGNVGATVGLGDYYATLARWLNLPASEVLIGGGTPISTLGI